MLLDLSNKSAGELTTTQETNQQKKEVKPDINIIIKLVIGYEKVKRQRDIVSKKPRLQFSTYKNNNLSKQGFKISLLSFD